MKRLIALAILAAGLLYVAYAAYSIDRIVAAIETGDSAALAARIDFPSVRESLKDQANAVLASEPARAGSAARGGDFAAALHSATIGALVDTLATPSGLAAIMAKRRAEGRALSNPSFSLSRFLGNLSVVGPATLRLGEGEGEGLIIAFRDWTWKIVEIRASPEKLQQAQGFLRAPR